MTKHGYLDVKVIAQYARKGAHAISIGDETALKDAVFHLDQMREFISENVIQKRAILKPELVEGLVRNLESCRSSMREYHYDGRDHMRGVLGHSLKKLISKIREYQYTMGNDLATPSHILSSIDDTTLNTACQKKSPNLMGVQLTNPASIQVLRAMHPWAHSVYNYTAPTVNVVLNQVNPYFTSIMDRARARLESIAIVGPSVLQSWQHVGVAVNYLKCYCATDDVHVAVSGVVGGATAGSD